MQNAKHQPTIRERAVKGTLEILSLTAALAIAFVIFLSFQANEKAARANLEAAQIYAATFRALLNRVDAAEAEAEKQPEDTTQTPK